MPSTRAFVLAFSACCLLALPAFGQTNAACSGAIALVSGVTNFQNTVGVISTNNPVPTCQGNFGNGVWYTVTPSIDERVNISTCGSDFGTVMQVYIGDCGVLTPFTCEDRSNPFGCGSGSGQAGLSFSGTAGTTYYILVGGYAGAGGNLQIVVNLNPPPTNDTCAGAIALQSGVTNTVNTVYATELGDPSPTCQGNFGRGVWYMVTPTIDERVNISTCGSDYGTVMEVYTGACGALSPFDCTDRGNPFGCGSGAGQAGLSFSGTAGVTYYILVGGISGNGGNLQIVANLNPPPPNDTCAGAIALQSGVTNTVNTLNATELGDPAPSCQGNFGRGVWYTVTPAIDERVNISTCGSDFGTVMEVYTGTCGALSPFTCEDRGNPFGCSSGAGQAGLSFSGLAGTTYYILVGGISGNGGNLQIVANLNPPPPNDTCANAIPLGSGVTNSVYTFNATEFGDTPPTCQGNFGRGVWYTVTTTIDERVNISTCGSDFGTVMEVYTGPCGALTPFTCEDRGNPFGCGSGAGQAGVSFSGTAGTTYYILVGGISGNGGNLQIVANLNPPPPNDTCANAIALESGVTNSVYTFNATEFGDTPPTCQGNFGRGVWYTVTPTINERVNISTCGSDFGTVMEVYTGPCGALTPFTCEDRGNPFGCSSGAGQAGLSFSGLAGTTYYILVGGISGNGGNLQIVANLNPPPANDICATAIPLESGVTNSVNTFDATEFGEATPTCQGNFGRGVWYTVTPQANGQVTLSTCGSSFGTVMEVYVGACDALTPFTCEDRGNPFGCGSGAGQAGVSFTGAGGTTYYILVGGISGNGGNLQIVANAPGPANDTCASAVPMTAGVTYTSSTYFATTNGDPNPTCIPNFGRGVWYTYTPTVTGPVGVTTCGSSFDTALSVYLGSCGALSNIACSHNAGALCVADASVTFNGLAGTNYFILAGGNNGAAGTLQILVPIIDLASTNLVATNSTGGLLTAGKSFSGGWTVLNQGANGISGTWTDQLILSNATTQVVLASFNGAHSAPAIGSYSETFSGTVPQIAAGNYSLIAQADSGNLVPETNKLNNTQILAVTVTNIAPAIVLESPTNFVDRESCVQVRFPLSAHVVSGSYTVTNVIFFDGNPTNVIGHATNAPYIADSLALGFGAHIIGAQVVDLFNLTGTSLVTAAINLHYPTNLHVLRGDFATNGDFVGCMCAYAGSNYVILSSTNANITPSSWPPYVTNQASTNVVAFTNHPTSLARFFRARLLP